MQEGAKEVGVAPKLLGHVSATPPPVTVMTFSGSFLTPLLSVRHHLAADAVTDKNRYLLLGFWNLLPSIQRGPKEEDF